MNLFDDKNYNVPDKMRSPGYTTVTQWLSDIWREFDTNIIINSFDQCGITSQNNILSTYTLAARLDDTKPNQKIKGLDCYLIHFFSINAFCWKGL